MNNSDEYYKKKYLKYKYKYLQRKKKLELTGGLASYLFKKGINIAGSTAAETIIDGAMTEQMNKDKENKLKEFCRQNDLFSIMSVIPYYDEKNNRFIPNVPDYLLKTSFNSNKDEDKKQPENHGVFVYSESGKTILYLALDKNKPKNNEIMKYIEDILNPYSSIITIKSLEDFYKTKLSELVNFLWKCIKNGTKIGEFFKKDNKKYYLQQSKLKDHIKKKIKELPNEILETNKKIEEKNKELNKKEQNSTNISRDEKISIIEKFIEKFKIYIKLSAPDENLKENFEKIKTFANNNIFASLDKDELNELKFIRDNLTKCFKSRQLSNEEQYIKLCNRTELKNNTDQIDPNQVLLYLQKLKIIPPQDNIDKELAENRTKLDKLKVILLRIDNLTTNDIKLLEELKYDITSDLKNLFFVKSNLDLCFKSRLLSDEEFYTKLCKRKELNQNNNENALEVLDILQRFKIVSKDEQDSTKKYKKYEIKTKIEEKLQEEITPIKKLVKSTVEKNTKLYKETEILLQVNEKIENYLSATNKLLNYYKNEQNAETLEAEQDVSKIKSELERLTKDKETNKISLQNYTEFKDFLDGCSSKAKLSLNWLLQTPPSNNFCTST
jgi:hypothetical protein